MRRVFVSLLFCAIALVSGPAYSTPAEVSSTAIAAAKDYCASTKHSIMLNADRTVLCFDGDLDEDLDVGIFNNLKERGLFVMRSPGGYAAPAMALSDILRAKDATVVLYDYCLSACANWVLVATNRTYVTKNTIVAWHTDRKTFAWKWKTDCNGYLPAWRLPSSRPDERAWVPAHCRGPSPFFKDRQIAERHLYEPPTLYTRRMVSAAMNQEIDKDKIFWTWHPKNQGDYFKSRIIYESYPTEDEVAEFVRRSPYQLRIVYDPEP